MAAIVIADASPLIALARVNGLDWLQHLFTEVMLTDVVLAEVLTGRYPATEAPIRQALAAGWLTTVAIPTTDPALPDLDEGEASSIRLALSCNGPALLLIDERSGRAVAQDLGLRSGRHSSRDRPGPSTRPDHLSTGGVCGPARQRFPHRSGGDQVRA